MDLRELHFGVEIETVWRTRKRVAEAIQSVVGGSVTHPGRPGFFDPWEVADTQGRTWRVVSDGSLSHVPSHLRAEVVTPVLAYGDIPTLQEVIRAVRKCGAKVDRHCGIHVHVDASRFDGRTLGNLAKTVYKQEPLILAALGVTENRQQTYTRPVRDDLIRDIERHRPRTTDELNRIWYGYHNRHPQHFDSTRYHGVNLHNVWYRGTVEFRWFEATLHAGKVKAYIQSCAGRRHQGAERTRRVQPQAPLRSPKRALRLPGLPTPPRAHRRRIQDRAQTPAGVPARGLGFQAREIGARGATRHRGGINHHGGRAANPASSF